MSLLVRITLRLAAVAFVSLACTVLWILHDTNQRLRLDAETSAERLAQRWEGRPGLGSIGATSRDVLFGWDAQASGTPIIPGVCVVVSTPYDPDSSLCNARDGLGGTVPAWFATLFERLAGPPAPATRDVVFRGRKLGSIRASVDPVAATERAWQQISVMTGLAASMATGMCLLAWIAIGHALRPTRTIIRALRDLEHGEDARRLPYFATAEFDAVARAFNDLAARLQQTTAERAALTRRLFDVQEDERRGLARELHDAFGQCLTASGALAASMAAGAPADRPDLAEDARSIGRLTADMQGVLRGALARLRVPDLEEIGLEASLRSLVGSWNRLRGGRTRFLLEVEGDLSGVEEAEALGIYRIVQECLTNAARHGDPATVVVRIAGQGGGAGAVSFSVEDDGGGDPAGVDATGGFGVIGMRERIRALGGRLAIGRSAAGLVVSAVIPAPAGAHTAEAGR
ncbi:histidine kinase [Methyloraptor flagellatus]|uniref:Histidine kinase n=1 Tax=Methyloraptor flagellatus TaxID=3162530 RepID=A0AAU7XB74_9HYPH